ncbi:MAG TPA: DUF5615 family PIN-like protein [Gaiellaceae bacterium]
MKVLLHEMYPSLIARELQSRGHDVLSVRESPGAGASDEQVLAHARSSGRAVVTENVRDFRPLAEALLVAGESHAGLVFTTGKRWPRSEPGALIAALNELLASTSEQPVGAEF